MKNRFSFFRTLLIALIASAISHASAQTSRMVNGSATSGPIAAGKVVGVSMKEGIVVMKVGDTGHNISFYGMDRVPITNTSGRPVALAAVETGMSITVHYVSKDGKLYIASAVIPDSKPVAVAVPLTRVQRRTLASKATNDNDITTH